MADIKQKNPDANVVALGDFNDFQFAESLEILEGNIMTNLVKTVPESSRYSYVFQGNSQVLDHVIVSNNLVDEAEIDMLHVNADYTDMAGRASDHDPVLVQLALVKAPLKAEKFYNFKSFKTTRLLINKPSVDVQLDRQSVISQELQFTGQYGKFTGEGFANTTVRVKPETSGSIVDFGGSTIKKVIVDGKNVQEIHGAENIETIEYVNGGSAEQVKIMDVKGEPVMALLFSV